MRREEERAAKEKDDRVKKYFKKKSEDKHEFLSGGRGGEEKMGGLEMDSKKILSSSRRSKPLVKDVFAREVSLAGRVLLLSFSFALLPYAHVTCVLNRRTHLLCVVLLVMEGTIEIEDTNAFPATRYTPTLSISLIHTSVTQFLPYSSN